MNHMDARQIALASASGLLLPLCFPNTDFGWLAWVALVPLHLAIDGVSRRRAFWLGWLSGTLAFTGIMMWVVTAMTTYGKVPLPISYAILLLLTVYLGLYVACYSWMVVWLREFVPRYGIFAAPCAWVSLELARTYLLSGFPWCLLGYSQYRFLDMIQIADHAGVYGVSFLIVLVNLAAAEMIAWLLPRLRGCHPKRLPWELAVCTLLLLGLSWNYGTTVLRGMESPSPTATLTVGLVQPNVDQAIKWDTAFRDDTMARFDRLTGQFGTRADLVIWPEAATPFLFEREPDYQARMIEWAERAQAPLLFGSPALRYYPDRRPYLLNSAYLLSADGTLLGRYDKHHLVPFGEYIPLKSSVLFFLEKLVEGIGDFEAGPGGTVLTIQPKRRTDGAAPSTDPRPVRFGVAICYEVIFPDLVRQFAVNGAEFLVTITNDGWFGRSSAPAQHFAMVVFRAVENHLAFARAANTGISGAIDPFGRILHTTPIFTETAVLATVEAWQPRTFYSQHGDVFAYGCVVICVLLFFVQWLRPKEPEPGTTAITPA